MLLYYSLIIVINLILQFLNNANYMLGVDDPVTRLISSELLRHAGVPKYGGGFALIASIVVLPNQTAPLQKQPPAVSGISPEEETALMDRFSEICGRIEAVCKEPIAQLVQLGLMQQREQPTPAESSSTTSANPPT